MPTSPLEHCSIISINTFVEVSCGVIRIAHRISHGTNVVVVSIQSKGSKKILLFAVNNNNIRSVGYFVGYGDGNFSFGCVTHACERVSALS